MATDYYWELRDMSHIQPKGSICELRLFDSLVGWWTILISDEIDFVPILVENI